MPRLIIRDCSSSTTEFNVRELCSKIGQVEEVYIPKPTVTGIVRRFAIANINCTDECALKYIKALNGSNWNGSRISIEFAKEYYKDRLQREAIDEFDETAVKEKMFNHASVDYTAWKAPYISLRVKANAPCIRVSTVPGEKIKGIIPCGWKGFGKADYRVVKDTTELTSTKTAKTEATVSSTGTPSVSKLNTNGGGLRKGFGSIALPTVTVVKTVVRKEVDCCIDDDKADNRNSYTHSNSNNNSSEYEEFDQQIDSRYGDDDYSEPYLSSADLEDDMLRKERERAISILDQLLGSTSSVVESSSDNVPKTGPGSGGNGWSTAVIKRFDPSKVSSKAPVKTDEAIPSDNTSTFAHIDVLKDIFYKQGGVGWNEHNNDVEVRSSDEIKAADSLFLDAEKFGIDVRNSGTDTDTLFNFFGDEKLDESSTYRPNGRPEVSALVDNEDGSETETNLTILYGKRKLLPPLSLDEIKEMAAKFCRISSVDVLKAQWEEQREKLSLDYKKKARESKKKGIAKSVNVESVVVKNIPVSSVRKSNYSGKNTRGGVKHSKKRVK